MHLGVYSGYHMKAHVVLKIVFIIEEEIKVNSPRNYFVEFNKIR